jgi:2-hydroxychromene-2-carboxylate isomerase
MKPPVEFFFDPVSPYSYLATTCIDALAARHGRRVVWRPTLVGVTVVKVMGLKPVPQTPMKSVYSAHDLARLASMFGVPLRQHGLAGVNSLAACRAFLWLDERDPAAARGLARHLSARLWVDGIDITPPQVVVDEASSLGIDIAGLPEALGSEALKAKLSQAVEQAIARNVFGVPYFVADGEPLWGADRMWMLDHWLANGDWPRRFGDRG